MRSLGGHKNVPIAKHFLRRGSFGSPYFVVLNICTRRFSTRPPQVTHCERESRCLLSSSGVARPCATGGVGKRTLLPRTILNRVRSQSACPGSLAEYSTPQGDQVTVQQVAKCPTATLGIDETATPDESPRCSFDCLETLPRSRDTLRCSRDVDSAAVYEVTK